VLEAATPAFFASDVAVSGTTIAKNIGGGAWPVPDGRPNFSNRYTPGFGALAMSRRLGTPKLDTETRGP
jgi:hypothetical protein